MKNPKLAELRKLMSKLPVERRRAIIRVVKMRGTFKLIRGGRYEERETG